MTGCGCVFSKFHTKGIGRSSDLDKIKQFLDTVTDVNVVCHDARDDHNEDTLLGLSIYFDNPILCNELLKRGARTDILSVYDRRKNTELHRAIRTFGGRDRITKLLLEYGADTGAENNEKYNAHMEYCYTWRLPDPKAFKFRILIWYQRKRWSDFFAVL